ncbi:hypothetical protein WJX72_000615 [[Myrmecia] bisecta]|uniref:Uncharacterized protein n=1 Tax=[Myrmecia] bisecta TaxID=41462 RepID=A0AAW1P702_9CHLO
MAAVEVAAPAVEETEAVSAPEETAAAPVRKERVKRLSRPDDTEMKAQVEKLQAQIDSHQKRVEEIKEIISSKQGNRQSVSGEQQVVRNKLMELRGQFQAELSKKQQIRADLENATKARDALRAQMRDIRAKGAAYTSVEQVDEQIRKLEHKHEHTSLTLAEEKKLLEDLKRLRASRGTVQQYNDRLESLHTDENVRIQIVERLKACDDKLNAIKGQEEGLRTELNAIRAREQEQTADIPSLIEERNECREVINAAYTAVKEIRAAHRAKVDEFYEREREWKAQQNEERKRKQELYQKERAERDAARKARDAEMAGEPFDKEVTLCEQLQNYLSKFVAAEETKVEAAAAPAAALDGMKIVQRKADKNELDGWFSGLGKGKGKGRKGKGSEEKKPADVRLMHSIDMLDAFGKLKVEVPLTSSKVPATLESIKARKEFYLQKRKQVKENGGVDPEEGKENVAKGEANGSDKEPLGESKENSNVAHANGGGPSISGKSHAAEYPKLSGGSDPEPSPSGEAGKGDVAVALTVGGEGKKHDNVSVALTVSDAEEVATGSL